MRCLLLLIGAFAQPGSDPLTRGKLDDEVASTISEALTAAGATELVDVLDTLQEGIAATPNVTGETIRSMGLSAKYEKAINDLGGAGYTTAINPNGTVTRGQQEKYYRNVKDKKRNALHQVMENVRRQNQILKDERKEMALQNYEANRIERQRLKELQRQTITILYQKWLADRYANWTKARIEFLKTQEVKQASVAGMRNALRTAAHSAREAKRNAAIEARAAKRALAVEKRAERAEAASAHRIAAQANASTVRNDRIHDAQETLEARWAKWAENLKNADRTEWALGKNRILLDPVPNSKAVTNWRIPPPKDVLNKMVLEYVLSKEVDEDEWGADVSR